MSREIKRKVARYGLCIILAVFLFISCIDAISLSVERVRPQLVIEGRISNDEPPYQVRLSSITNFDGTSTDNTFYLNAKVIINEIGGESYELKEIRTGYYESDLNLKGRIGSSYQLIVELKNGDIYQSDVQTILEPVNLIGGRYELREKRFFDERFVEKKTYTYDVEALVENTESDHFYKVESSGWAKVEVSYPECRDPPPGRSICWSFIEKIVSNQVIIGNNLSLDEEDNYYISAVSVPADSKREYIAIIRLNTTSSENYIFWERVKDQLDKEGSIFDSPFAPVIGNITNNQTGQRTLGYFHAYSSSEATVCIDRTDNPLGGAIPPTIPCSLTCVDYWNPATYTNMYEVLCE